MQAYQFLPNIDSPADLRRLNHHQLQQLCGELRRFLVESVSATGGHLASNLGVVELTVAMHRMLRSPVDQIVWDVGHQSYVHKLLTGRRGQFDTLRQEGGISGFPKTAENEHDSFVAGHASTSIAVADGIARAKRLRGEPGHAVAVIGDGAFTGGMAYEGLNNAARMENSNLIVVLNDNEMSISKNNSSIGGYLTRLRTNQPYFRLKDLTKAVLHAIPVVGERMVEAVGVSKSRLKNALYGSSFFEDLGFVYMGPVDGHDLAMLCAAFERARALACPVFLHVKTVKGKGYRRAENNPGQYHGVGKFNPYLGNEDRQPADSFSDEFGKHLVSLAVGDSRICAITAAMKYGTGLNHFKRRLGDTGRFVDVGIAEEYAVTFAAGLAKGGLLPVCAIYSSFLQRGYDQIIHDCAIEPRHVVLAVDRAGLVGEDGETHHGLFDCAYLSSVPGMTIYSPSTYDELKSCIDQALYHEEGIVAVRYPRGAQPVLPEQYGGGEGAFRHFPGEELLIITYGREWGEVCAAADLLRARGMRPGLLKMTRVFPIDPQLLEAAMSYPNILFIEEGMRSGGIGEHFLARLAERGYAGHCLLRAVEGFVPQGAVENQLRHTGLDAESVARLACGDQHERERA